jgi:hypothetical protein
MGQLTSANCRGEVTQPHAPSTACGGRQLLKQYCRPLPRLRGLEQIPAILRLAIGWLGQTDCRWQDLLQEYSFSGNASVKHLRSPGTAFMSGSASGVWCSVDENRKRSWIDRKFTGSTAAREDENSSRQILLRNPRLWAKSGWLWLQVNGRSDGNSLPAGFHWHSTRWGEVTLAELTERCRKVTRS